ncbi:hypothetical protein [Nocardia wallacei]|uniref:hypothetical protein n=1 Tax=Nocardia wallacei TaxID=480035 RepID=UPI002455FB04|nr:hypothetical protein [Nocardia wallacei]
MLPVQPSPVYEVRFGFTPKGTLLLVLSAACMVAAIAATETPALPRVALFTLAALATVTLMAAMTSPLVAFRVDAEGITLGGNPVWRYQASTVTVPWSEITGIVLYTPRLRPGRAPTHIKLLHDRNPAPDPEATAPAAPEAGRVEWVTSRPVRGCRFDRARFATALAWHAPHIPLADST